MHILLAVGVTILTAGAAAQAPVLAAKAPITVTFLNTLAVEDALSFLSKYSGVTIEIDQSVPPGTLKEPLYDASPITMREVTIEQALQMLTRLKGLDYTIVDARLVRVFKKA